MNPYPIRLLRSVMVTAVTVLAFGSLAAATPPGDDFAPVTSAVQREREGNCRTGPGEWNLRVRRASGHRLRISYRVDEVVRRQRWQVFMGVDGRRVAAVTRTSNLSGEFQVEKVTRNRRGRDRVAASAVNPRTGAVCNARLRF